jgi:NADPH:quinone reductase-like Zn-dependent oxidoreductase
MRGVHRAAPRDETLKVPIQHTYDLAQAPDALQTLGATHTQGKLALRAA